MENCSGLKCGKVSRVLTRLKTRETPRQAGKATQIAGFSSLQRLPRVAQQIFN